MPCTSGQLYSTYQLICRRWGIGKPAQQETLSTVLGKKPGIKMDRAAVRNTAGIKRVQRCIFVKGLHEPPDHFEGSKIDWMSGCVDEFTKRFEQLQEDGVLPYPGGASSRPRKADAPTEEEAASYGR